MDPFAEKDLIDLLKSIALTMKEIKDELFDIKIAIKDLSFEGNEDLDECNCEDEEDGRLHNKIGSEFAEDKPALNNKFSVAKEDSYLEIEPNKEFEEDDELESDDLKDSSESGF